MNLVIAIVQSAEADTLSRPPGGGTSADPHQHGGGFFRRGNATLLIGVEPERLEEVLALIQANCRLRTEPNPVAEGMPMYGATVFVLEHPTSSASDLVVEKMSAKLGFWSSLLAQSHSWFSPRASLP